MKKRLLELANDQNILLFGARNTGKSTLIKQTLNQESTFIIDLLDWQQEQRYARDPQLLEAEVKALGKATSWVVIDEVQKISSLLDVVHRLIESTDKHFIMSGSSARKLKRGHANLLAGRAFVKHLYPFSFIELGRDFELDTALTYGMLPKVYEYTSKTSRADFLRTYTHVYLKEEIWAEHLIRKLQPFQYFLEVAAQTCGTPLNIANIARDVGVDHETVQQYFAILEDTLVGFHLPAFQHSFRKRLGKKPKFYFFDIGVQRALSRTLSLPLSSRSYEYGNLFEHFVIIECYKLIQYFYPDYRLSHLRTHDDVEIDLVIERPGLPLLMIEIKSSTTVRSDHLRPLKQIKQELGNKVECTCFAQVPRAQNYDEITVFPWQHGIEHYLPVPDE